MRQDQTIRVLNNFHTSVFYTTLEFCIICSTSLLYSILIFKEFLHFPVQVAPPSQSNCYAILFDTSAGNIIIRNYVLAVQSIFAGACSYTIWCSMGSLPGKFPHYSTTCNCGYFHPVSDHHKDWAHQVRTHIFISIAT